MFQFTLPCRERRVFILPSAAVARFQFTLPCRERLEKGTTKADWPKFQFTLPCRERRRTRTTPGRSSASFNSRSRVGSDSGGGVNGLPTYTFQFTLPCRERPRVPSGSSSHLAFQFTLPCRERHGRRRNHHGRHSFNSRSRVGSDNRAPAPFTTNKGFNSRSRVGSDPQASARAMRAVRFQFTLPCRERRPKTRAPLPPAGFNSRSRVGSDREGFGELAAGQVSIHAPV